MTATHDNARVNALLLDVEGTTTPVSFVYETLFPYARASMKEYLSRHLSSQEVRADIALLREEHAADLRRGLDPPALGDGPPDASLESLLSYAYWLMDNDRKSTPLKSLQGRVWEEGYRTGRLRGEVYPDVPRAFERWRASGREIAIFSSGSVLAQKLLFAHAEPGDLTPFIRAYFDTTTGPKGEPQSYAKIAAALARPPAEVLFISDVVGELDAARAAGMRTLLRVAAADAARPAGHEMIETFNEVLP